MEWDAARRLCKGEDGLEWGGTGAKGPIKGGQPQGSGGKTKDRRAKGTCLQRNE